VSHLYGEVFRALPRAGLPTLSREAA
jgi:hypothetical protein